MGSERSVRVDVFSGERYEGDWPPEALPEFMTWLREKVAQIPKKYRPEAQIDIDSVSGYEGDHYAHIKIYYYRPETKKEAARRLSDDCERRKVEEMKERSQYEALKAKFERAGLLDGRPLDKS